MLGLMSRLFAFLAHIQAVQPVAGPFFLAGVWLATVTPARVSLFLGPPCCFFQQSYIYVALMYPDVNHISVYTTFSPDSIKFRPFRSVFRGKF